MGLMAFVLAGHVFEPPVNRIVNGTYTTGGVPRGLILTTETLTGILTS